jgi:hypothetical protein
MPFTVEQLCQTIDQLRLMSARELATVKARWFRADRKERGDAEKFCQWLRANRYLSPFVIDLLGQGKADELVLNQYRVSDQIQSGPLAGGYLATDPLGRPVIIQVFSATVMKDPTLSKRVREIVGQLIALDDPHVCRALDAGEARGLFYGVRQHYDAETLADVLKKRGKLPPDAAARIFTLACEGLRALHERKIPGGALTADCVLLTAAGKGPRPQRSVRLLVGPVSKEVFDAGALGAAGEDVGLLPLEGGAPLPAVATPADDVLRLGCLFYQALAGRPPFPPDQLPRPHRPAQPLREAAPEVPEMLAGIVEEMIEIDLARRAKNAGHLARALRVFLKAEEDARDTRHEDHVVIPPRGPAAAAAPDTDEEEAEEAAPRKKGAAAAAEGVVGKLRELWEEVKPQPREWAFLGGGAVAVVVLVLLVALLTGISFINVVCLATGGAAAFFVERLIRWREGHAAEPESARQPE